MTPAIDRSRRRKVFELSFRTALRLGHNYIGTEHVLLALLEHQPDDGVLATLGITTARVEPWLLDTLQKMAAR